MSIANQMVEPSFFSYVNLALP